MSKYTFTCEHWDGSKVTFEKEADALSEVLESFEFFLKGSGFYLNGQLDIVPEETESAFDTDDDDDFNVDTETFPFDTGAGQPVVSFLDLDSDIEISLDTNVALHPDDTNNSSTIVIK